MKRLLRVVAVLLCLALVFGAAACASCVGEDSPSGTENSTHIQGTDPSPDKISPIDVPRDNDTPAIPPPPDDVSPVITNVSVSDVTASGAVVTWTTSEPASGVVEFGTRPNSAHSTAENSGLVTSHSVQLTGLAALTLYYFRVVSNDAGGNEAASADQTFTTARVVPPPDQTPPGAVTGLRITSAVSDTTPTVAWDAATDGASGVHHYLLKVDTGDWVNVGDVTIYTRAAALSQGSHTVSVRAVDGADNQGEAGVLSFTIQADSPPDEEVDLEIVSVTSRVAAGSNATLVARTEPGAYCTITVYYKSGPSEAAGLYDKSADGSGGVSWTWKVGTRTTPGSWEVVVTATLNGVTTSKSAHFTVT